MPPRYRPHWLIVATLLPAVPAAAGFVGWAANVRSSGGYVLVDVLAMFGTSTDHMLNTVQMSIAATGGSFVQQGDFQRRWSPYNGMSRPDTLDSFVTLGMRVESGVTYAAFGTTGDPDFTNYSTPNATTIPTGAGWFNNAPLSNEGDTVEAAAFLPGVWQGAAATRGVWVAHLVLNAATLAPNATVSFDGWAMWRAAGSTAASQARDARVFLLPGPGAAAIALAGATVAPRRRRR